MRWMLCLPTRIKKNIDDLTVSGYNLSRVSGGPTALSIPSCFSVFGHTRQVHDRTTTVLVDRDLILSVCAPHSVLDFLHICGIHGRTLKI